MIRVHELAKRLNKTNSEVIQELRAHNVPVSSHASQLTDEQVQILLQRQYNVPVSSCVSQSTDKQVQIVPHRDVNSSTPDYENGTYLIAEECFIESSKIMDVQKLIIDQKGNVIEVIAVNQIYVGWSLICSNRNAYWNLLKELAKDAHDDLFIKDIIQQYANNEAELKFWLRSILEARDAFKQYSTLQRPYIAGDYLVSAIKSGVQLYFLENADENIEMVYQNIISILPANLEYSRETYIQNEVYAKRQTVEERYGQNFEKAEEVSLYYNNLNGVTEITQTLLQNNAEIQFWEKALYKKFIEHDWGTSYIAILMQNDIQLKQNYIRCMENELINRFGIIKERKVELLKDLRDITFEDGLELYKTYKQQYYDLKTELKEIYLREEVSAIYEVYLEYFKMGWVQISSHLNSISKSRAKKKDIPQRDLEQALMYFYEADTVSEAEKLREQSNYIENRKYGLIGESEVHYALKWLDKQYIIMEPKTYGKYGERILVLSNPEYIDVVQEYDHIIIGEQGIFIIETKNFVGKLIVDEQQNWIREKADGTVEGERNPLQQLRRHEKLLRSIVGEEVNIISVICMAHPKLIIEGSENCTIPLIKSDMLVEFIENYETEKILSKEERESYQKIIENHMPQTLERSYK